MTSLEVGRMYAAVTIRPGRELEGVRVAAYDPESRLFTLKPSGRPWRGTREVRVRIENVVAAVA